MSIELTIPCLDNIKHITRVADGATSSGVRQNL